MRLGEWSAPGDAASVRLLATSYSGWLENLKPVNENAAIAAMFRRLLWHIGINVLLVVSLFIIGAYVNAHNWSWFSKLGIDRDLRHTLIWACALFLSLPMLIAVYRKAEALGMLLAELGIRERFAGSYTQAIRNVLARVIPLGTLLALAVLVECARLGHPAAPRHCVVAGRAWRGAGGGVVAQSGEDACASAGGTRRKPWRNPAACERLPPEPAEIS